jgi:hypothetical protein
MVKFGLKRKFDNETYKLATLHGGVTKAHATKTAKMNKREGNKARIIKEGRKYATYVRK